MTTSYEDIFDVFLSRISDNRVLTLSEDTWTTLEKGWLKSAISNPRIRNLFSSFTADDDVEEIEFELTTSVDSDSDVNFINELLGLGMSIAWMEPQINSILNTSVMIGGKEEKKIRDNYKTNVDVLKSMKQELKKMIRDYGYLNNSYIGD